MLWEAELKALAGRKRALAAESDQLRYQFQVRWQAVAHQWRWVDRVQRVVASLRPVWLWGVSLLGFRKTSLRGRLLRLLGAGFAVARAGRRWLRRRRA